MDSVLTPRLVKFFCEQGYKIEGPKAMDQVDYYMDTPDDRLMGSQHTFRIRVRGNRADATYKMPVVGSSSCGKEGQMERYEHVCSLTDYRPDGESQSLCCSKQARDFIEKHLDKSVDAQSLTERITIKNHRSKYRIFRYQDQSPVEEYELVLDRVTYTSIDTEKTSQEKQLEIELKSDPMFRLNMLILTGKMEEELSDMALEPITDSKYERARRLTAAD